MCLQIAGALQISQPTLSHHMKILCDAGIVIPRKEGKWTHYRINEAQEEQTILLIKNLLDVNEDSCEKNECHE